MTSFNLTSEPWIAVERLDGSVTEMSTRDALATAHDLRGVADSSPLVVAAVTRHLLAVLHRAYDGPRSISEWTAIAAAGGFDPAKVAAYLDSVRDRMDLFHPIHPFAQTRGLLARFGDYVTPIDELEVFRARWGGARELFRHRPDDPPLLMSPARATRALLAHHAFTTGGLIKKPGEPTAATAAPLVRSGVVVVRGDTLFLTLVANLLKYNSDEPIPTGGASDLCSWEQDPPPTELLRPDEPRRIPLGYLDMLTWLSRRVELVHKNGVVTGFINAVGQGLSAESPRDPMVAYRRHDKFGWSPIGIDVARAFWRSADALFETARSDTATFERPRTIDLVSTPEAIDVVGDVMYDVELLGISAEKSRVDTVRVERVQARGKCFSDPDAGAATKDALTFSKNTVAALRSSTTTYARVALSPGDRSPDSAAVRALADSLGVEPAAWSAIGEAFESFLRDLSSSPEPALDKFRLRVRDIATGIFQGVTERADNTGRWLKARALAERSLLANLPKLDPTPETRPVEGGPVQ
jgi:CRISPR system Cascade subunit CasA